MNRIAIAQPLYGPTPWMGHISMVSAVAHAAYMGIPLEMRYVHGSYIDEGRNTLVQKLLEESEATHLFFIDQDVVLPAEVIPKLLADDKPVVGATYFVKQHPYYPCALHFSDDIEGRFYATYAPGLTQVDSIGMGATLIRREVFEKMAAHFGDERWYWINRAECVQGEDVHFARRCKEIGVDIWMDGDMLCGHESSVVITYEHHQQARETPDAP